MVEKIIKSTHYKLILLLAQLEPSEWRALKKFILMYTRESSDNFELFTLLRKDIDHLNTNEEVKQLHQEHFPQMTSKTYSNMMSRLTVWVEDWMVYEDMRKSDDKDIRLIRLYNSRGLYKESNAVARKAIKTAKNKPGLSLMASKNLAQIYYYQYFSNNPIKFRQNDLFDKMVSAHLDNIHNVSLVLQNQQNFIDSKKMPKDRSTTNTLNQISKLLPKTEIISFLTHLGRLIQNYNLDSFLKVKAILENNQILSKSDLHTLSTTYLFNRTIALWSQNKFLDSQIVEEAINYALESGVLLTSEKIDFTIWHTIVSIISTTRSYKKSEAFIDKWNNKVNASDYKSLKSLSMAQVCFHQKRYAEIRDHIYNMEILESQQKNRANSLIVISLFKDRKNNYSLFINFANNYLRQLKRSKSKMSINVYNAYYNLTLTLISLAHSSFSESRKLAEDSRSIMYRKWLREEIKKADTNN